MLTPTPISTVSPVTTRSVVASNPQVLVFKAKSVWANLRIRLETRPTAYGLLVQSDVPMAEWYLLQPKGEAVIAHGSGGMRFKWRAEVPSTFADGTRLKVIVQSDEEPKPIWVMLGGKGEKDEAEPGDPGDTVDFPSAPSRPYNGLVKDLYLKAYEDGRKGRYSEATASLDQALKLDPTHPLVLELRANIRKKMSASNRGPDLREIKRLWKAGDDAIALEKLDLILRDDPDCVQALALKKDIEAGTSVKPPKRRKKRKQTEEIVEATPTLSIKAEDKATLADTSYNLGLDAYRKGNYSEAKKFWEETVRYQPHHAQARNAITRLTREHPELDQDPKALGKSPGN